MKVLKFVTLLVTLITVQMNELKAQNPEIIVQKNLDAYNDRNLTTFMSYFSDDIKLVNFSDQSVVAEGKEGIEKLYGNLFEQSPQLHSNILKRMILGNKVIDHESITGRKGVAEAIELIMVYEIKDNKIYKMTVIRPNA